MRLSSILLQSNGVAKYLNNVNLAPTSSRSQIQSTNGFLQQLVLLAAYRSPNICIMSYQDRDRDSQHRYLTPQLRHSCDACNNAKVKCSKTKPRCTRCEARKAECLYSVSLRSSKGRHGTSRGSGRSTINESSVNTPKSILPPSPISSGSPLESSSMLPLQESNFDISAPDGWNTNFSDIEGQSLFPDFKEADHSMMLLPNMVAEDSTRLDNRDESIQDQPYMHHPPTLDRVRTQQYEALPRPTNHACSCCQNILAKLSETWVVSRSTSIPFDKLLSENKCIVTLCTSALNCPNWSHADDIIFMLTLIALITQIITIYDRPDLTHCSTRPSSPDEAASYSSGRVSSTTSNYSGTNLAGLSAAQQGVRLSLGTFELDQRDEQVLKANLLRIELDKVGNLIDLFEKRCCSSRNSGDGYRVVWKESKPSGELLSYLRKRLRACRDSLQS